MLDGTEPASFPDDAFPQNNQQFLEGLFGRNWGHAHVCAIPGDPRDTMLPRNFWAGAAAHPGLALCGLDMNNYYCVSLFAGPRQLNYFRALVVLAIDDVGPKVEPDRVLDLLGPPSYRLETSPGNEQWGYRLRDPLTHGDGAGGFVHAVRVMLTHDPITLDHGKDPGMENLNRLVRLPFGTNGKTKGEKPGEGGGGDFRTRLVSWGL